MSNFFYFAAGPHPRRLPPRAPRRSALAARPLPLAERFRLRRLPPHAPRRSAPATRPLPLAERSRPRRLPPRAPRRSAPATRPLPLAERLRQFHLGSQPLFSIARVAALLCCVLLTATASRASELSDDLKARRARVMEKLGPDAIAILWSAPSARYSLDVDYEYRQDSNLYYLTGITQEETILVLMPGNESKREILFVWDRNLLREHWTGHRLTHEEATERSGIDTVLDSSQFDAFIATILERRGFAAVDGKQAAKFFDALAAGRGRVALTLDTGRAIDAPLTPSLEFARKIRDRFVGFQTSDATPILTSLRLVKTPYERKVLTTSLEISSEAQLAGMRAARADAYEYEVVAAIEAVHRSRGAVSWSYPSIVGSGPNATTLHYHGGERQMHTGDLILVDAAANYQYASGD